LLKPFATHKVLLEAEKISNINTGLGQFSFHLINALLNQINLSDRNELLSFLINIKKKDITLFSDNESVNFVHLNLINKFIHKFSPKTNIWHSLHQDSPYFPSDKKTPYILTIHDLNFLYKKNKSDSYKSKHLSNLQKKINRADYITTISKFTLSELNKHLTIPKNTPCKVIYNGSPEVSSELEKPKFIKDQKFIFTIGVIQEKKNFHVLIDFMKKLKDFSLVIAGDNTSSYAKSILNKINNEKIDNIIIPGKITDSEKNWLYKNTNAFIFPSLSEGFGIPIIEAMKYGAPVFCSNYTSIPEVVGPYGYFFSNFKPEHMVEIFLNNINDANTLDKIYQRKQWANKFNWNNSAKQYLSVYKELIKEKCLDR
jgi:glycosyltransferase involved in cell wall biosynthesis